MISGIGKLLLGVKSWALDYEGSSRSSALIRIGLVALIWARWANEMLLYKQLGDWYELLLCLNFFAATTLMGIGLFSRLATAWTAAVILSMYYYFGHERGVEPWTHHHSYLLAWASFLLAFTPCGRSYSVDRWLAVQKALRLNRSLPAEHGPLWGLRLIALQLSLLYFWTAVDKTTWGFLSGDRMEHYVMWYYIGSNYPHHLGWLHSVMMVLAWVVVIAEYLLAPGMLFARSRRYLVYVGIVLHAGFYFLLPVYTYSLTMLCLYLAYFDANAVHRLLDRLQGQENRSQGETGELMSE